MDHNNKTTEGSQDGANPGRIWLWPLVLSVAITLVVVLAWLIWASNYFGTLAWTGFAASTNAAGEAVSEKTLWDWLGLLIVPATLALGGLWFSNAQKNRENSIADRRAQEEREIAERRIQEDRRIAEERTQEDRRIAEERTQETALQTYLDQMSKLLIDEQLSSVPKTETKNVARVWTLTVLRRVNEERKGIVLRFLYESHLIQRIDGPIVSVAGANLRGVALHDTNLTAIDLQGVNLRDAYLMRTNLSGARLRGADLRQADFTGARIGPVSFEDGESGQVISQGADLVFADFRRAKLDEAVLTQADLVFANLTRASLTEADLTEADLTQALLAWADFTVANLTKANLTGANLMGANLRATNLSGANLTGANLEGAKYDEDTIWPDSFDPVHAGAKSVSISN